MYTLYLYTQITILLLFDVRKWGSDSNEHG